MLRVLFVLISATLFMLPQLSYAAAANETFRTSKMEACGGTILTNNDCSENPRSTWHVSCCEEGYRVQGVHYARHTHHNTVDALSAVCRSISKGNDAVDNDDFSQEKRINSVCHKTEILTGVTWKDKVTDGGEKRDSAVEVSAICLNPTTGKTRTIQNMGKENAYTTQVSLPKRVVGIATKEHLFDTTDCTALVVK
ncbi:MAG: hypothetical protein A3G32_07470 [Deltaproteobacteria bacterium RIFCSPLOWO2_12_FULL_40_28]|nr:MAG: hypothetical protein A3C45_08145 [Deltaproteobacteria bacterium RIFCSPHIGHO2_02_FULL_40_28]OGQ20321.1 MAG: hypothetical protein A3E27_00010 [Deltaproteobacteria bacterium RIFCSPHIGHO2_12_FULL_40_32]OGQ40778.1 MAG: hypothetical protein A3I69_06690 [Deltaproteobacteria bacterium RIFCSPLOWO2_02_FULL_40_36]OGQ54928.1 MAG: hypothetical protein A3G32_07470 [Deltaproteobacteria bacterium RIFCSPLOWO2_12_FULL_40_28]